MITNVAVVTGVKWGGAERHVMAASSHTLLGFITCSFPIIRLYRGGGYNNGNAKKLKNRVCVGYNEIIK
jgi:hypothetical protein